MTLLVWNFQRGREKKALGRHKCPINDAFKKRLRIKRCEFKKWFFSAVKCRVLLSVCPSKFPKRGPVRRRQQTLWPHWVQCEEPNWSLVASHWGRCCWLYPACQGNAGKEGGNSPAPRRCWSRCSPGDFTSFNSELVPVMGSGSVCKVRGDAFALLGLSMEEVGIRRKQLDRMLRM